MDKLEQSGHKINNLTKLLKKVNDRADKAPLENEINIEMKKINVTLR